MTTDVAALVEYARRSHENAERTANAALRMEQGFGRMERELGEVRKEMRKLNEVVGVLSLAPPAHKLSKSQFNPTDTGTHRLVPEKDLDQLLAENRQVADARAYRGWRRRIKSVLLAVAVGSATFAGEHLAKWLLHIR